MRVLLVNPPYPVVESLTMPLGLLYLAARLEQGGHEVFLEDLQLSRSPLTRLEEALHQNPPAVAGITSFSLNLSMASKILRKVKRLSPETVTLWGGPHVSFDDREILHQHPWVDAVVRGEGEETLAEVVDRVRKSEEIERKKRELESKRKMMENGIAVLKEQYAREEEEMKILISQDISREKAAEQTKKEIAARRQVDRRPGLRSRGKAG